MTTYAIKSAGNAEGEKTIDFVKDGVKVETVLYVKTQTPGQFLACTEDGETFGYRHVKVDDAIDAVARVYGWTDIVKVSAAHPSVRRLVEA